MGLPLSCNADLTLQWRFSTRFKAFHPRKLRYLQSWLMVIYPDIIFSDFFLTVLNNQSLSLSFFHSFLLLPFSTNHSNPIYSFPSDSPLPISYSHPSPNPPTPTHAHQVFHPPLPLPKRQVGPLQEYPRGTFNKLLPAPDE